SLTNEERELLLAQASEEVFAAGHSILQESDPPDRLFVILSGRARALETTPSSPAEVILSEFGEGEILGELAVIRNRARSATVVATERTHCLVLNQNDFLRVLQTSVGLALALLRTVAGRLAETDRRLSRYAPDPVTGLASRRAFDDQYRRLAAVARRRGTGALMLVLDVVQLRAINDRFGYGVGDDVLRAVADALIEATRTTDLVARHGSDEFAVFFPDAGPRARSPLRIAATISFVAARPVRGARAMSAASAATLASSVGDATTRLTRPMRSASLAWIVRPVSRSSHAQPPATTSSSRAMP